MGAQCNSLVAHIHPLLSSMCSHCTLQLCTEYQVWPQVGVHTTQGDIADLDRALRRCCSHCPIKGSFAVPVDSSSCPSCNQPQLQQHSAGCCFCCSCGNRCCCCQYLLSSLLMLVQINRCVNLDTIMQSATARMRFAGLPLKPNFPEMCAKFPYHSKGKLDSLSQYVW